jgi:hypothetical protein
MMTVNSEEVPYMTNTVHGGPPPDADAVKPVVFSHEATDASVPRPATGERAQLVDFSADTVVRSRASQ